MRDDADRRKQLDWLRRTVEVYGWRLYAFVRMTTHYNGSDTGYFHRRHRRWGHLFPGRFKGHLIEEQGSFLEVSRYVHLNPVRAKRVARPDAWPWSSCPGYLRAGRQRDWVCYERVLGEFGREGGQPVGGAMTRHAPWPRIWRGADSGTRLRKPQGPWATATPVA